MSLAPKIDEVRDVVCRGNFQFVLLRLGYEVISNIL
jgi:hypothetical protein